MFLKKKKLIVTLSQSILGMYGGTSLKAKRYSALKSTTNKLYAIFLSFGEKNRRINCCLSKIK